MVARLPDTEETLLLVDENDEVLGPAPKLETHRSGQLHRAFSVFLFDEMGDTLIQRRADVKYHSRGKWANSCCGHPRPGEAIDVAATRRVMEELGLEVELNYGFTSRYCAQLDNEMIENEFVHLLFGRVTKTPAPHPDEVSEYAFVSMGDLRSHIAASAEPYAVWLVHYVTHHFDELNEMAKRIQIGRATTS
ncbi:MAG: isopentenyl-diphosphate Delta-isomerase [Pseudomonadota bacterium]